MDIATSPKAGTEVSQDQTAWKLIQNPDDPMLWYACAYLIRRMGNMPLTMVCETRSCDTQ
jgi:hypothetical protein